VEIEGRKIRVNVEAEKNLPELRLYLNRWAPDGASLLEKRELPLATDYEDEGLRVLKAQSECQPRR